MVSIPFALVASFLLLGAPAADPKKGVDYTCTCTLKDSVRKAKKPPKDASCTGGKITAPEKSTNESAASKCFNKDNCPSHYCDATAVRAGAPSIDAATKPAEKTEREKLEERFLARHKGKNVTDGDLPDFKREYAQDWSDKSYYTKNFEPEQGFSGIYDPQTGNVIIRPSTPQSNGQPYHPTPRKLDFKKDGGKNSWVVRGGGHEDLANNWYSNYTWRDAPPEEKKRLRAFTLIRDKSALKVGDSPTANKKYLVDWKSNGVNNTLFKTKDYKLPAKLADGTAARDEVLDAIRFYTSLEVREMN